MPYWLIKFWPVIAGVVGLGAIVLSFNLWLNDRDRKVEMQATIERQEAQLKSDQEAHAKEIEAIKKDLEAREKEKQLEIDRKTMNEGAIADAKQDPVVKGIYVKGQCNSPAVTLW